MIEADEDSGRMDLLYLEVNGQIEPTVAIQIIAYPESSML